MRPDTRILYSELERAPEDWSLRLRLIESAAERGDWQEAKRLVRTSPGDRALPSELQERIHSILTGGAANVVQNLGDGHEGSGDQQGEFRHPTP